MLNPGPQTRHSPSVEPTREELAHWDREIVWHAFTQMSEYEPDRKSVV